jgi:SNF2 family DNA or RNA helicase
MTSVDSIDFLPLGRTEYYRNAVAVIPVKNDPDPGLVMMVIDENKKNHTFNCNCRMYKKKGNCIHVKQMAKVFMQLTENSGKKYFNPFSQSPLYRLASVLHDVCPVDLKNLIIKSEPANAEEIQPIGIYRSYGDLLITCFLHNKTVDGSDLDEKKLFDQRTGLSLPDKHPYHRGRILTMLSLMTMTDSERVLKDKGMKSRRQAFEESFWHRLIYHFWNIYRSNEQVISSEIEESTGRFLIRCRGVKIVIPRQHMLRVSSALVGDIQKKFTFIIWRESLESIVKVTADDQNNLKVDLYLLLHLPDGSIEAIERQKLKQFWYNDTVYIPEKKVFATWRKPDRFWNKFGGKYSKKIKQDRLPEIIEKIGDIFASPNIVDQSVHRLQIHREYDRIEIETLAVDRDWCWLSFQYGFGEDTRVSLKDIYNARKLRKRFLPVLNGWVDLDAIKIETLIDSFGITLRSQLTGSDQKLRLSRLDLLRFQASSEKPFHIAESTDSDPQLIRSILEMRPPEPVTGFEKLTSPLRFYQQSGVEWMAFLYENRLGGMLCDEMGLGKTHQVMALMVWLSQVKKEILPFIVVCPTTVISHWSRKIQEHASTLLPIIYHGADRELENIEASGTVLITSYGILLRDFKQLAKLRFSIAVFDEAQHLKNPDTKSYSAAGTLKADLKLMVTGTPVENRLGDLKALMDMVLPGYLGNNSEFQQRYEIGDKRHRESLRKLISPFTLRRTKAVVLNELPEKIEDIRYCRLTDTQVRLYRQAVSSRGKDLLQSLQNDYNDIPYIHIFALLNLLKQICNHPASISGAETVSDDQLLDSGKWELFVELVDNCLENDLKIIVFSQFVKMIDIIVRYFKDRKIITAGITGKTRNRGNQVDRFNNDPECKVFIGSLKAGGSGIDLTGGSVVIHYDRWWNAAKEDQATDRVHRIGQTRGVQVFKLVTEGTLEEKISAIIAKKKNLMHDVIAEDDPGLLKYFSREDLIDLIKMPE